MEVQKLTHEVRLQHWGHIVSQCRSSGQTIKAWCKERQIHLKTYYYWQKRVCQATCHELSLTSQTQSPAALPLHNSEPVFAELALSQPRPHTGKPAVTIQKRDVQIHIYCGADAAIIETTLSALKSLC